MENTYKAYVVNDEGLGEMIDFFTSIESAAKTARVRYGRGWTVIIEKMWKDGDGQSWNPAYNVEVMRFRIRK